MRSAGQVADLQASLRDDMAQNSEAQGISVVEIRETGYGQNESDDTHRMPVERATVWESARDGPADAT